MVNLVVVEQLLNHISRFNLCKTTDKILLAVSGGIDSMVMFHLLREAGFRVAVAHCNFQLRGEASDGDQQWVEDMCRRSDVTCFVRKFDTSAHATHVGISVQMAARDLRYRFFEELIRAHGFDWVATAHHFSDVVETVLLNLVRGTGMNGLRGIAVKKNNIIRPLLFATREMIAEYARQNHISWREDESNDSDDYQRNFLRHRVVPNLKEMNPAFEDCFRDTHERLLGASDFAMAYIRNMIAAAVTHRDENSMALDMRAIRHSENPPVLLWEIIKNLGFRYEQCRKIAADHQPGKIFLSETHQLLVDRTQYIIDKRQGKIFLSQAIAKGQRMARAERYMLILREVARDDFKLVKNPAIAQIDADHLAFPILWRKWEAGDYFIPLGMQSGKKVSDFLIDLKIPFNAKADITVLESGGDIVWIVGHRIHERYRVTQQTKRILVIEQIHTSD